MNQQPGNQNLTDDVREDNRSALLDRRVAASIRRCSPLRLLLMSRARGRPGLPDLATGSFVELRLDDPSPVLRCRMDELPFGDGVFDVVIVSDLFRYGYEPELGEAQRVLKAGGVLLVCGRGRLNRSSGLPLLNVRSLCRELQRSSFDIRGCELIGLLGRNSVSEKRWLQPLAGLSHSVLLRARHHDDMPTVTPLRFRQQRAPGVRAALDSVSREAV